MSALQLTQETVSFSALDYLTSNNTPPPLTLIASSHSMMIRISTDQTTNKISLDMTKFSTQDNTMIWKSIDTKNNAFFMKTLRNGEFPYRGQLKLFGDNHIKMMVMISNTNDIFVATINIDAMTLLNFENVTQFYDMDVIQCIFTRTGCNYDTFCVISKGESLVIYNIIYNIRSEIYNNK